MKKISIVCFISICFTIANAQQSLSTRNMPFDSDWRFLKDNTVIASDASFDDSKWRKVELPHDWSIEDLPNQSDSIVGPFTSKSIGATATGYTEGGVGWYRKHFTLKNSSNKKVIIHFDGVYMNSDVWINGHHLGNHPYGYTPFYYDLSPYLKPQGQQNVISVRVKNDGKNSRWYSGSGIYRHVWLTLTESIHFDPWGVYITTPEVSKEKASIVVRSSINNEQSLQSNIELVTTILSPEGKKVGYNKTNPTLKNNETTIAEQNILVSNPSLWSIESPKLYKAVIEVWQNKKLVDRVENTFGIRSIRINANEGFVLNGESIKLKGGCIHHDNGLLGAATINRAEERKIEILKKNGFNAIRTSHNPPSQQLLDACDRLGMLVIDEAFDQWQRHKNPDDYGLYFDTSWKKDIDAMVLRDRNHPSVVFWSIGNEINERADAEGLTIAKKLSAEVKQLDNTRPVTEALCFFWDHAGYKWDTTAAAFALLDVGGYNYQWKEYVNDHAKYPGRIMMGTESFPLEALENWEQVEKHSYVIGDFVWTAVDYLGETGIGHTEPDKLTTFSMAFPWYNAWCGDIDILGNKKPQSYYRDVVWRRTPIAMAVHTPIPEGKKEAVSYWGWPDEMQSWTWQVPEGKKMQVRVFSRASMVRLYLNGKIVGEQKIEKGITAVFEVTYQPGILKAVNIENGKETDAIEFKTAGTAKNIRLTADRKNIQASRNDLSYVMVEVTDDKGQLVPNAELPIQFSISGSGEIATVGNGSPNEVASFQTNKTKTMNGKCLVIIRPNGKSGTIVLKASAAGFPASQTVITTH